jgi:hypothetical protein
MMPSVLVNIGQLGVAFWAREPFEGVTFDAAVKVLVALNIAAFAMALWTLSFALIASIVFDAESLASSEVIVQ